MLYRRMFFWTISIAVLVFWTVPAFGQLVLWSRTYGGSSTDWGTSVQLTQDQGYIVSGHTYSFGAGAQDVYLIKNNSLGDTQWTRTYGGSGNDKAHRVEATVDGGYVVTAETRSFGAGGCDGYLIKTDSLGDTLWTRTYGGSNDDRVVSVQQTADGGYILAGYTESFGAGNKDVYLIKTDCFGITEWSRAYGGSGFDGAYSVRQTSDGGYVVAGKTGSFGAGGLDGYLIKTDSLGDTLWTRTYGGSEDEHAISVEQTADGGYIVAGYTESFGAGFIDVYLIKTDSLGDTLWAYTYGGSSEDVECLVQQTEDEGYIVAGYTESFGSDGRDAYLIKTDSLGDTLWSYAYGGSGVEMASSVQQTEDEGYIVAGYTGSFGAGSWDFMLTKFDSRGNACIGEFVSSTVLSISPTVSSPPTVVTSPATVVTNPPTTVTSPASEINTICELVCGDVICEAFLTSRRINVGHGPWAKPDPGYNSNWRHDFKIHIIPCDPMDVSVGDSADVFVDVDTSGTFDEDENYLAIVSSTDIDGEALDIAIKVYIGEELIDNDPCVAIYSINNIPIVDTLGNQIDYLCLDTFDPHGGDKPNISGTPKIISLKQNYPNPFNPETEISYFLLEPAQVRITVYNVLGRRIRTLVDEYQTEGLKRIHWDGKDDSDSNVASGIYFYRLDAAEYTETKKMVLMR
jgi:hypothetical protein